LKKRKIEWRFVGVRVPKEMVEDIDAVMRSVAHTSRSEFIRDAIRRQLERLRFVLAGREAPAEEVGGANIWQDH